MTFSFNYYSRSNFDNPIMGKKILITLILDSKVIDYYVVEILIDEVLIHRIVFCYDL